MGHHHNLNVIPWYALFLTETHLFKEWKYILANKNRILLNKIISTNEQPRFAFI